MPENAENTTATPEFKAIETQEELDKIIETRLARERRKFEDYDQLKELAAKASGLEEQLASVVSERDGLRAEKDLQVLVGEVAKKTGVPASALRGSTREELESHAGQLKELLEAARPVAPVVKDQGAAPSSGGVGGKWQQFAKDLFGTT